MSDAQLKAEFERIVAGLDEATGPAQWIVATLDDVGRWHWWSDDVCQDIDEAIAFGHDTGRPFELIRMT